MPLHDGDLELALLTLLSGQERYGLDLAKELRDLTGGDLDLNAGTLYPALHRLERRGWLRSETRPSPRGGHALRYYTLTDDGEQAFKTKRDAYHRWHQGLATRWGNS
ncbi:PadR family transcriptional regulator [Deinococcus gobiensis]|uniref:Transcriptional regulator, PadR-like family n=1 Tax=Deinococcus gobiensis (strain DSM 21396 / JCM 16679 / CGMCC 1.7299 / I-0) TaxID=745776 RepID=H8H2C0_DEIGI|nr:PadR family transcriptional regulator [Deinococcus gobiensis]AFD27667.1 Transcriptional regulator, PadR-like family [Deinococcus gobiensis I-0]